MKVFGYIRVSTEEQAEKGNSLFEQEHSLRLYAKSMDWDIELFIDDGASAKDMNRKQLQRLIQAVQVKDNSGIVITTKLDRLSRKLRDILELVELFSKNDFTYVSRSENIETSSSGGRMFMQMLGSMAEFERERISERVKENMLSLARSSSKVITRPCFGYEIIDDKYVVHEEQATIIKMMYGWALEGMGATKIAGKLNAMNIKSATGTEWSNKTITDLFYRDTLVGDFVYNKTSRQGTKTISRPESEWIRQADHHPAVVDRDMFERVKQLINARKGIQRRASEDTFLLSGLVRCSHCGSTMPGKTSKSKNTTYYHYLCDGYTKKGICKRRTVKREELEDLVIQKINEVSTLSADDFELDEIKNPNKQIIDTTEIKKNLERVNVRMQKQIDAYNDDLITAEDLKIASERAKKERNKLQLMIDELEEKSELSRKKEYLDKVNNLLDNVNSSNRVLIKQTIRQLVYRIIVSDDGIKIMLRNNIL